jgi:hypothetical protein
MSVSQLSELVLMRHGPQTAKMSTKEQQAYLAERFEEEIKGLAETAEKLRSGRLLLMPMGDESMMMMEVKVP